MIFPVLPTSYTQLIVSIFNYQTLVSRSADMNYTRKGEKKTTGAIVILREISLAVLQKTDSAFLKK